jgi:hypothetical protein
MELKAAVTEDDLRQIRELFGEYFAWVRDEHGINLAYQGIADELTSLPAVYALPRGCLLLAQVEGRVAGCIASKPPAVDIALLPGRAGNHGAGALPGTRGVGLM